MKLEYSIFEKIAIQRKHLGLSQTQVDKNTMGSTGTFSQIMRPEYYRIGDISQKEIPDPMEYLK